MANAERRPWKWVILTTGLVALLAGGLWYFKFRAEGTAQYQTTDVARGDLTQVVTATGQLNPVTNVQVGCQISGTISKLSADFNSPVTNGQVVAQLDPATYQANLHQAEGDLANAKAGLELARVNADRSQELFDGKLIPKSDYDQAFANLHQAEATVEVKEAAVENARVNLERCTIYSPVDGMIISRNVDVGQTVAASLNAPTLFVIANDLTKMQIDANVAEADIGGVEDGQNVDFTVDAFPYRTFHGEVVQVRNSPITVQNVVTYDTVIGVSNPDLKLKPGMTANVSIIIAQRNGALKIPNAALRFRPPEAVAAAPIAETNASSRAGARGARTGGAGGWKGGRPKGERSRSRTVYVLDASGKPKPVEIKTGISDGVFTEVTEGLTENDRVITGAIIKQDSGFQSSNPFGGGRRRF
ncbi:MAG TPA: efflux RND transporter periplasmic adaptor subunit [Verrucomicrobiae bacterium]|nr:efflux RND transporter periplasmic adaptor subunit [Verrucomicrobiae bacterium]